MTELAVDRVAVERPSLELMAPNREPTRVLSATRWNCSPLHRSGASNRPTTIEATRIESENVSRKSVKFPRSATADGEDLLVGDFPAGVGSRRHQLVDGGLQFVVEVEV